MAGYCVVNDVSEREYQIERGGQWDKGKGCDTFGPIGPWLVTRDEIADPQNLDMWLDVDGKRYQNGNTRTMIFGVAQLVSYVSQFMTLQPGDVITTGTPPGVGMGTKPSGVPEAPARRCDWASAAWASSASAPSTPAAEPRDEPARPQGPRGRHHRRSARHRLRRRRAHAEFGRRGRAVGHRRRTPGTRENSAGSARPGDHHVVELTDEASVGGRRRHVAAHGRIDILVNNAGITGGNAPTWELTPDVWRRVIEVNLIGPT